MPRSASRRRPCAAGEPADGLTGEPVDLAALRAEVELARSVQAESRQALHPERLAPPVRPAPALHLQARHVTGAVVAEEVAAGRGGHRAASVDVAARDRTVASLVA